MTQKKLKLYLKKAVLFFGGLLILSSGIVFSTVSGLGVSPLNCLAFALGEIFGIEMGYITMLLYFVYVFIEFLIKGKNFRAADLLQIPVAILFGLLVNFTKSCLSFIVCVNYVQKLLCCAISIVMIAAGTTIYVIPQLALQAPEGLILAICERWNFRFGTVKSCFDMAIVVLAFIAGILFKGQIIGIREGTLLAAVGVGVVVNVCNRSLKPVLTRFMEA